MADSQGGAKGKLTSVPKKTSHQQVFVERLSWKSENHPLNIQTPPAQVWYLYTQNIPVRGSYITHPSNSHRKI